MSSSSDSEDDEVFDNDMNDRTHRVFHWSELNDGENRFETVQAFTRILKRQGFVRIILPEAKIRHGARTVSPRYSANLQEVNSTYNEVVRLADTFFTMEEEEQACVTHHRMVRDIITSCGAKTQTAQKY